jgi:hypothetical protein
VTDRTVFSDSEWSLLVHLPQWALIAASAAQPDNALRTAAEKESGFIIVTRGRESGNPFVVGLANQVVDSDGDPAAAPAPIDFSDRSAGIATVLEQAQQVASLLAAKADPADCAAYRRWLLAIVDVVVRAARSGDILGFGGKLVTDSELSFRNRLDQVLRA